LRSLGVLKRQDQGASIQILGNTCMNPMIVETLGYLAATLTTISFAPQAWLIWKTRSAKGISLGMYSAFVTGIGVWLLYGLLIQAWPLVVSNAITFVLSGLILWMKVRYG
jgi:MtN3 and saliva related transmembrane protein